MLTYHAAARSDADELAEFSTRIAQIAYRDCGSADQLESWIEANTSNQAWRKRLAHDGVKVYSARWDAAIIGCIYVQRGTGEHDTDVYLGGWYVGAPGRGIGGELMRSAEMQAAAWGCTKILAEVPTDSASMFALIKHDYRPKGKHPGRTFAATEWLEMVKPLVHPIEAVSAT